MIKLFGHLHLGRVRDERLVSLVELGIIIEVVEVKVWQLGLLVRLRRGHGLGLQRL
jgi:hypothetical protein